MMRLCTRPGKLGWGGVEWINVFFFSWFPFLCLFTREKGYRGSQRRSRKGKGIVQLVDNIGMDGWLRLH
jgi:hypothetical protein